MATSILPGTTRSGGHARTYKLGAGLRMRGATSGRVGILPPATITDYDLTLPGSLAASDKLLQVSSAGVVSLVDPVTIGGTGTEILYRGGVSSAAAVAGSSWDGTTLKLPLVHVPGTVSYTFRIGSGSVASGGPSCAVGVNAIASGTGSVAIGSGATGPNALATGSIAIGWAAYSAHASSIAIGTLATTVATNQFVSGSGNRPINNVYFGKGVTSATPTSWTLNGTGGSGTNVVGGTLYIAPGPSTGNATPSAVVVQSTVPGTSGSTSQALADTLTVTNNLVRLAATTYQYWGPEGTDGSWRIGRSGNDIVIERRESGVWVTKSTISA